MRKSLLLVSLVAFGIAGTTACASKGFVKNQVSQVSGKVDTLSQSLEETQERTKQNEAKIGDVDQKAQAAQGAAQGAQTSADAAKTAADSADGKAVAANDAAKTAADKVDALGKSVNKISYTLVLSDAEGNFKFGSTELPADAKAKIDDMISQLEANPNGAYFEIEGYTDNVGPKDVNERIGMERAEAVKQYLYEQHQIPLHRMNVISYGPDKPAASNDTKDGRAQNRRVVIRVLN
jgi:outer membrane protein OmpA-like peptidoglycan-associated protein